MLRDHYGLPHPGISALLIRDMGISAATSRVDVVGMGCNAGLNALNATAGWAVANPGKVAVMLCTEACSAAYVMDSTLRTAVVNSLFGDGAAAIALIADTPDTAYVTSVAPGGPPSAAGSPRILGFASHLITEAIDAMRYDWDDDQGSSASTWTPRSPTSSAPTRSRWSTGCWTVRDCAAATSRTGWCTRAARRSSTPYASTSA